VTCLQAGVPSVAVPTQGEQDFNAHRLAELGLGAIVPVSDLPPEPVAIRDQVVTLAHRHLHRLEERLAAALGELGPLDRLPALPGADAAAAAIERI
jgi:UDP:flavonoid glycosyltransferase YjiC (YdhE family)